jgi:hypothetical protein
MELSTHHNRQVVAMLQVGIGLSYLRASSLCDVGPLSPVGQTVYRELLLILTAVTGHQRNDVTNVSASFALMNQNDVRSYFDRSLNSLVLLNMMNVLV